MKKKESRTLRYYWDKWHWKLTWLAKEKERGTRQCNLINTPMMVVLYFPLLFLFFPSLHREGFSTQQCKLQWLQTEICWGEPKEYAKSHGSRRALCRECHMKWLPSEIWQEGERNAANMRGKAKCWKALLEL